MSRKFTRLFLVLIVSAVTMHAQTTVMYNVILRSNVGTDTMWDGVTMRVFGMAPTLSAPVVVPARTLYCNEGDSLVIDAFDISQNDHHTVHLHGLDANTRNDGDPMTSFWLNHMQDTTYSVRATHAGTYFYHCHVADVVHQQMGMYGFIVVRAAGGVNTAWTGGPAFSQDYNWMLAEYDRSWHDSIPMFDPMQDTIHVPPYVPDYFLINGHAQQELLTDDSTRIQASVNEPVYLRLGNMGYCNDRIIFPASLQARIIDSDGRPLPAAVFTDTIEIAPGESYGVLLIPTVEFSGTIEVQYRNMNNGHLYESEFPPVIISGFFSVNDLADNGVFSLYPNPSDGNFTAQLDQPAGEEASYALFGADGKVIASEKIAAGSSVIVLNTGLPAGLYFLRVTNGASTATKKIQVAE